MNTLDRQGIRTIVYCGIFTALICVGAFIKIPTPLVPFTLQNLLTTLSGMVLGPRKGMIPVMLYILLGLSGLPIFSSGGGIGYIMQPTFGYILGFIPGAFVSGYIAAKGGGIIRLTIASFCGMLMVYMVGLPYMYAAGRLYTGAQVALNALITSGFLYTLPADIIKSVACAILASRINIKKYY